MGIHYGFNSSSYSYETITAISSGAGALSITGNTSSLLSVFKTSGSSTAWDIQAYSLQSFTAPCTIQFRKDAGVTDNGQSYAMIGWNEDPTLDASYSSIDHAAYPYRTDQYVVYNNGTQIAGLPAWDKTKPFYIVYDTDGLIRHYNGSTLLYTSASYGTNKTVYLDSSYYIAGNYTTNGFKDIRIVKKSWDGNSYV